MDRAPSPSADRSWVGDRSTAIHVTVAGLELPGFRFDRVFGHYADGSGFLVNRINSDGTDVPLVLVQGVFK